MAVVRGKLPSKTDGPVCFVISPDKDVSQNHSVAIVLIKENLTDYIDF